LELEGKGLELRTHGGQSEILLFVLLIRFIQGGLRLGELRPQSRKLGLVIVLLLFDLSLFLSKLGTQLLNDLRCLLLIIINLLVQLLYPPLNLTAFTPLGSELTLRLTQRFIKPLEVLSKLISFVS
jgi:hypothetical protein